MYTLIWGIVADSHGIASSELEGFFKRMLGNDIRVTKDLNRGSFKVAKDFESLDKARDAIENITRAYPHQAFWKNINYDWQDVTDETGDSVECDECGTRIPECERGGM
jgi:hypothetical protein